MAVDTSIHACDFVVLLLSIFGAILNAIFLFSIAKKMYNKESTEASNKDATIITNVSILSIICYSIFCVLGILAFLKLIFIDKQHGNDTTTRMFRIGAMFYVFSNNGLLLFILLIRINYLSIYPLYFKKITYIVPIITVIMVTVPFTVSIFDTNAARISHPITIMMTMIVIIIYIILMIMYLKQIHFAMKQRIICNKDKNGDVDNNDNKTETFDIAAKENDNDKQVDHEVIIDFNTIQNGVRYSVLTIFCVSSTLSVPIWTSIGQATKVRHPSFISYLAGIALMIDAIINSISIFFLFGFVKPYYFRLCNLCHQCIMNCCIRSVIKSVKGDTHIDHDKQQYKALIIAQ